MALNLSFVQHVKPPHGSEGVRTRVQRNDVLVCITGALTGNVALVDVDFPAPAYVNQHVALVRPKRLTADVVTGKLDVRAAAADLPAEAEPLPALDAADSAEADEDSGDTVTADAAADGAG